MDKEKISEVFDNLLEDISFFEEKCSNSPKSNPSIKKPVLEDINENSFNIGGGAQIKVQNESNTKNKFISDSELKSLRDYFGAGFNYINGRIYNTDLWQDLKDDNKELYDEYDKKIPSIIKDINNVINKAPRLQEDTILYRMGYWEVGLKEGDTGVWDGFTSTSFGENNISQFEDNGEYKIKILALKGQKGICGSGSTTENWAGHEVQVQIAKYKGESEFLLPTKTRYIVKDVDDENRTATVVIY